MFSYITLEERVPQAHPLRKLRAVVDALLATMSSEFEAVYARRGRPSVPPEMLLKALLLQILFSIRSERQLVEAVNYNLLYRWFVGLNIEDRIWGHSTFSANRERLFNEDLARAFFERVKLSAQWGRLASDEHFSVDGTLIEAWASRKSFKRKDDDNAGPPGRYTEVDFKGQERCKAMGYVRPKRAKRPANRPRRPSESPRRRILATRFFEIHDPDGFDEHFFNGLLLMSRKTIAVPIPKPLAFTGDLAWWLLSCP